MSSVRGTLVERERELQELDRLVQGALEGQATLALVEGPAGIGKSRLLAAAREKAAAVGFRVLSARGSDLERELPFGGATAHRCGSSPTSSDGWRVCRCSSRPRPGTASREPKRD